MVRAGPGQFHSPPLGLALIAALTMCTETEVTSAYGPGSAGCDQGLVGSCALGLLHTHVYPRALGPGLSGIPGPAQPSLAKGRWGAQSGWIWGGSGTGGSCVSGNSLLWFFRKASSLFESPLPRGAGWGLAALATLPNPPWGFCLGLGDCGPWGGRADAGRGWSPASHTAMRRPSHCHGHSGMP